VLIITGDNIKFEFGVRATDGDRREIARYVKDDLEPGLYWFCFCGPVNEGHEPDFRIADLGGIRHGDQSFHNSAGTQPELFYGKQTVAGTVH
jgi:hypothetical protein